MINETTKKALWNNYVAQHPKANSYQMFAWQEIIKTSYGFRSHALVALQDNGNTPLKKETVSGLTGLLPLIHLKTPGIGSRLVSIPYFDHGGILADNAASERELLQTAIQLGHKLGAKQIELRQLERLTTLENVGPPIRKHTGSWRNVPPAIALADQGGSEALWSVKSHKVRMLLELPEDPEALMQSFKSKLRSQIKRAFKAGLTAKIGGVELLDDFYNVFSRNMRDLGSPVHGKNLPRNVLKHLGDAAWIVTVYKAAKPLAASLMSGFNKVMINPWSSALRQYSKDSPNTLLYWRMLSYAAEHGYRFFDFGRSTPGEGTYRFKAQWGAHPHPMYWYTIHLDRTESPEPECEAVILWARRKKALAVQFWQKLPLPVTRLIGPLIRKHIAL